MCIFMLVMMILMASGSDILGHLGGALYGFLFGMVVYPRPNSSSGKKMRLIGMLTLASVTVLCLGLLFGMNR